MIRSTTAVYLIFNRNQPMLKLNVGFAKKIGEANYGSRGANVNLELECESALVGDAERLRERIRHLFGLVKQSVEEELAAGDRPPADAASHAAGRSNGHSVGHANGRRRDGTRKATASQARALHVIADRQGVDLAGLLRQRFGVDQAGDLAITEASALIDELKAAVNGSGGRR